MSDKLTDSVSRKTSEISDSDRRTFLRNAALVTGAATVSGLAGQTSAAPLADGAAATGRKMVSASFDPKYELDIWSLQDVLEQILRDSGCTTCGLVGLDIRLGLDPVIKVDAKIPVNVTMHV